MWCAFGLVCWVAVAIAQTQSNSGCPTALQGPPRPVFFDAVPLGDFNIRTYQQTGSSKPKFYYAPLGLLEHTSASAVRNNLTMENQITFKIEMWTDELQLIVKDYLSNVTGRNITWNQVAILPFDRVSLHCRRCGTVRPDSQWRAFSQSPKKMEFRVMCPTLEECQFLANQMIQRPQQFSSHLLLSFRFDRGSTAGATIRQSATVTSRHIWSGRTMNELNKRFPQTLSALVMTRDRIRIISETLENVLADVEVGIADEVVIDPDEELRWRRFLENQLFETYIIRSPLDGDEDTAWNSLYWNEDENGVVKRRPDIVARELNVIFTNADDSERDWIVQSAHGVATGVPAQLALKNETLRELTSLFQSSPMVIAERLDDSRKDVAWNGTRFVPKMTKLSRINLDKLRNSFKTVANVSMKYSIIDFSMDLYIQPAMTSTNFNRNPQIPELKLNATRALNQTAETPNGNGDKGSESSPGVLRGLFQTIRGALTGGGIEIAPYTVLRKAEGYEERLYPAQKWVKTQMKMMSRDGASSSMFFKLFNYISGENDKQVKIPMTAPVAVLIEPGLGPNCESTYTMSFFVPAAFQEDPPQPNNAEVSIENRAEFKVFARTFGGFSNDRINQQEHDTLWASLTDEDKQLAGENAPYYFAGYDAPFKLFYRRNEVWIIQNGNQTAQTEQETCTEKLASA